MSDGSTTFDACADSLERAWLARHNRWRGYALSLTGNETDAEEIIQEALARTLRARPALADESDAHRYVLTAVRTAAWRLFQRRRRTVVRDLADLPEAADVTSDPLRLALAGEFTAQRSSLAQTAIAALRSLRPEYRQAIEMLVLREPPLKLRELAQLQEASISTVHSRLQAALRDLGRAVAAAKGLEP